MLTLTLFLIIITIVFYKLSFPFWYWKKRGIPYYFPITEFLKAIFTKSYSIVDVFKHLSNQYPNRRYIGSAFFLEPSVLIFDADLFKRMILTDHHIFSDHMDFYNSQVNPHFQSTLLTLNGAKWKTLRQMSTPLFTPRKLKGMFVESANFAKIYTNSLESDFEKNNIVEREVCEFYGRFTSDTILKLTCSLDVNSIQNGDYELYLLGKHGLDGFFVFKFILNAVFPTLFKLFKTSVMLPKFTKTLYLTVKEIMDYRRNNNISTPDFLQHFMDIKNQRDKNGIKNLGENDIDFTDEVIASQLFVFYMAGSNTTSTTLSFLTYELAKHPEIQEKLHKEIDEIVKNTEDGTVNYETLQNMKYLDMIVNETLRLWPVAFNFTRICNENYVIEPINENEKRLVIEKGSTVMFSIIANHYNSKYFPEPDKFDPERFNAENKPKIVTGSYLPFLIGNRNCIGNRFAIMQIKCILFYLMQKYSFVMVKRTETPLLLKNSVDIEPLNGIYIGFKKRF